METSTITPTPKHKFEWVNDPYEGHCCNKCGSDRENPIHNVDNNSEPSTIFDTMPPIPATTPNTVPQATTLASQLHAEIRTTRLRTFSYLVLSIGEDSVRIIVNAAEEAALNRIGILIVVPDETTEASW